MLFFINIFLVNSTENCMKQMCILLWKSKCSCINHPAQEINLCQSTRCSPLCALSIVTPASPSLKKPHYPYFYDDHLKLFFFQVPFRGYDCVLRKSGVSPDWPIRTNEISRMDLASMFTLSYLNHLFFPLLNHSFSNTSFLKKQTKNLLPLPCVPLQLLPHFSIPLHSKTSERADVTSVA